MTNEAILILTGLNGRKLVNGWEELLPILRLVDDKINRYSNWEMIQRNFLHQYRLRMGISASYFYCEILDENDPYYLQKEKEYYRLDTWDEMIRKAKAREVVERYGLADYNNGATL